MSGDGWDLVEPPISVSFLRAAGASLALHRETQHEIAMTHRCLAMVDHWLDRAHEHHVRAEEFSRVAEMAAQIAGKLAP